MTDFVVFKFRKVDKNLLDSLIRSQLYFANPESLNDPYDCQVGMSEALERAISLASEPQRDALAQARSGQPIYEQINNDIKGFGVCSFSLTLENQVLWSHYADQHCGLCLAYTIPQDFVHDAGNNIFGFSGVDYTNDALTSFFLNYPFSPDGTDIHDFAIEAMKKVLTIKSEDWAYEQEARMIRPVSGPMDIPPEFLTQVCFGLRTSDRDRSLITSLVNERYKNVNFVELQHSDTDFGIRTNEI